VAHFRYVGSAPPRADGTYEFRVRSKKFSVTFQPNQIFEIPDDQTFVLKCIRGHLDWSTKQLAYEEVVT
jgi:hypothetical protein